jgi:hypothetical protein
MLALLLLLTGERRLEPPVRAWLAARHARWLASEPKAWRDLCEACRHGALRDIYRAFTVWRRRAPRDAAVAALAEGLEESLFAAVPWRRERGLQLMHEAAAIRRARHRQHAATGLPPLNPISAGDPS